MVRLTLNLWAKLEEVKLNLLKLNALHYGRLTDFSWGGLNFIIY